MLFNFMYLIQNIVFVYIVVNLIMVFLRIELLVFCSLVRFVLCDIYKSAMIHPIPGH